MTTSEDAPDPTTDNASRRRRLLASGVVLGLIIAGAVLAITTALQQANTEAQLAADRAEARAEFADDVVDRTEEYEPPATAVDEDAGDLRGTLEQFLTETEVGDDELAQRVDVLLLQLDEEALTLEGLTTRDVPEPPELIDAEAAVVVLRELETLRAEAGALADEVSLAINDVDLWLGVVRDINQAVADHVAQVESEEPTSNPSELVELWRAERPVLLQLSAAATAADTVPALGEWASAHQEYAEELLAWIDEAIALLQHGDLDTYNERFDKLFGSQDPLGFNAAVAAATHSALASPTLLQLGTLQERATLVGRAVDSTEVTAGEQLSETTPAP